MATKDNTVLRHPCFDDAPVINPRVRGRRKGIPSLAMERRKRESKQVLSKFGYAERRQAAMEKILHGPSSDLIRQIRDLRIEAGRIMAKAWSIEEQLLCRIDPGLAKLGG